MTDVAKARQAAIAAETRVERTVLGALERLHSLNNRLVQLHDAIKEAQPVAPGAVCLELYRCGPGCSGCPHPRWVRYTWTAEKEGKPAMLLGINLDAQGRDPVLSLARRTKHYAQTAGLIREAKSILVERTRILYAVKVLRNAVKS